MRAPPTVALVFLGWTASASVGPKPLPADLEMDGSEEIPAPSEDHLQDPRWCRLCHQAARFERSAWSQTAHHEQTCQDCHSGYHFNPHIPVELPPGATSDDEGSTSQKRREAARTRCGECHAEDLPADGVTHGRSEGEPKGVHPLCHDCHGDPHEIVAAASLAPAERRRLMNGRCATCHGDEERMKEAELTTHSVEGYAHSVHARLLDLGSANTPGCVDCHDSHATRDMKTEGVKTCGECHEYASEAFVGLADHRPYTMEERPVSFFTLKFFAWLTFLTILFLCIHVLLDVMATVRIALFGRRPSEPTSGDER